MTALAFDPQSRGARKLANDWLPHLERWELRIRTGHLFVEPDGTTVRAGQTMEMAAPQGRELVERGSADLLRRHRVTAR